MIGPFMLLSVILVFFGGALFGLGFPVYALAVTALGAGWNGIVYATIQRMGREAARVKTDYVARLTGER